MSQRDALYYIMTGETFDGRKAAAMGLVNESVPRDKLEARVRELAKVLMGKDPVVLRAAKIAYRRVRDMSVRRRQRLPDGEEQQDHLVRSRARARAGPAAVPGQNGFGAGFGGYKRDG